MPVSFRTCCTFAASASPIDILLLYTLIPSMTESGRAKYTYSKISGANVSAGTSCLRETLDRVMITASPTKAFYQLLEIFEAKT